MAQESKKPAFRLPEICDHPNGWGPVGNVQRFAGVPFAPFSRSEHMGKVKVSDWNGMNPTKDGRPQSFGAHAPAPGGHAGPAGSAATGGMFAYRAEDEATFSLVDTRPKPRMRFRRWQPGGGGGGGAGGGAWGGRRPWGAQGGPGGPGGGGGDRRFGGRGGRMGDRRRGGGPGGRGGPGGGGFGARRHWNQPYTVEQVREPSVQPQPDWELLEEIDFKQLERASMEELTQPEDLVKAGVLKRYNVKYNSIEPNVAKRLAQFEQRDFFTTIASEDVVMQRLCRELDAETGSPEAADRAPVTVFTTDTILAALMAAPRSIFSWDILLRKEGNKIFMEKRPGSRVDFLTVNENWNEPVSKPEDPINNPENLSVEATLIDRRFSQHVLEKATEGDLVQDEPNPFLGSVSPGHEPAAAAYLYRRWNVDDVVDFVVRTELNGYTTKVNGTRQYLIIKALNEYDYRLSGGVNWRQTLKQQTGAVLASEMRNNSNKMTRWTAQGLLAGADQIIIGFVTRVTPKDPKEHLILKTATYEPIGLSIQLKFNRKNAWGIAKMIAQKVYALSDGKYLLLKDANEPKLLLYRLPATSFEGEEKAEVVGASNEQSGNVAGDHE